ncbi:Asp-tRNA(Asn)/Glu-tRNA(Gln) amidotransferase subunit GatC [Candidatus Borrarchaeum sp.]|uniref:Asp-tRNA(Asn)/Glu-tRNA(Gln) amidotransferase subunit GatC n=1 Tax=Candidatus Borrarchaeum sp. TaxID=2846742 RepID=UPI00257F115D|nr:Asp-tRNA(Asn)/Glu-tRNA(Gln) amidotransferase subunit GatC [Candidatus Borrarchaeum sp.]
MSLSEKEVEHIAELAKIKITEKEKKQFTKQFNEILQFFHQLDEIDISLIKPTFHVVDIKNRFRDDNIEPTLSSDETLKNAPKTEKNFVKAPKLFD